MGGRGQRRYWLLNKTGGLRARARTLLAPASLCRDRRPMTQSGKLWLECDLRKGHKGSHHDRQFSARMRTKEAA